MKNTDLCAAIQYIDDKYLDMADSLHKKFDKVQKENRQHFKSSSRILLIAAIISLLVLTACATNILNIRSLITGTWNRYKTYRVLDQAMDDAGFQISAADIFDNGYFFSEVFINETSAMDADNRKALSYNEIIVFYCNDAGYNLILNAHPDLLDIPRTQSPAALSKSIGDITINYYSDHYRFVPDDYILSDADRLWEQQPGNYISYGSEAFEETTVAFLSWSEEGIYYSIMDPDATESPESLFSMAEALIIND